MKTKTRAFTEILARFASPAFACSARNKMWFHAKTAKFFAKIAKIYVFIINQYFPKLRIVI